MFTIGITGGIGSGKSTAASILSGWGIEVLDADLISHQILADNEEAMAEILELFGEDILNEEKKLDREAIAKIVFTNKTALDKLSMIIHKHVIKIMHSSRQKLQENGNKVCVFDVPIPIEKGFLDSCDLILTIKSDLATRLTRLAGRGLAENDALQRISMQLSDDMYAKLSDYVVDNSGSIDEFALTLKNIIKPVLDSRGIKCKYE